MTTGTEQWQVTSRLTETPWLVDPAIAYLNHGGFGALPVPVAEAAAAWRLEIEANPTDVFMRRWQGLVEGVRARVAEFLRAAPADVVFVPNATTGTATVLAGFPLAAGDEIVTTDHRYPAVASQARLLTYRGVTVVERHVPVGATAVGEIVEAIVGGIGPRTRLVVVDHLASPTGFVFPVAEIVAAAHAAGVAVLIDAAHAPGQLDVDLGAIGADFWVGNLHKWVCSPRACAALVVHPQWQHTIRPLIASHDYAEGYRPAFDWTGTFDAIPLLTIPAALDFWDTLGWDDVRRYQRALARAGAQAVADALGTEIAVGDAFAAAMRLVRLPVDLTVPERLAAAHRLTTEHGVTAHLTEHAGSSYVRLCGQLYNVPAHYDRAAAALTAVLDR